MLVEKKRKMSATISKRKLPLLSDRHHNAQETIKTDKRELISKEVADAQRKMTNAMERGMDIKHVLSHGLLPVTPLFQGDLHTCTSNSTLVGEIETKFDLQHWNKNSCLSTHVVVDFMSKVC